MSMPLPNIEQPPTPFQKSSSHCLLILPSPIFNDFYHTSGCHAPAQPRLPLGSCWSRGGVQNSTRRHTHSIRRDSNMRADQHPLNTAHIRTSANVNKRPYRWLIIARSAARLRGAYTFALRSLQPPIAVRKEENKISLRILRICLSGERCGTNALWP